MARKTRRSTPRRSIGRGFNQNALLNGAMGGAAASIASGYVGPTYGPALGFAAVGMFRKDQTLQVLAGAALGSQLAANLALPGATRGAAAGGLL